LSVITLDFRLVSRQKHHGFNLLSVIALDFRLESRQKHHGRMVWQSKVAYLMTARKRKETDRKGPKTKYTLQNNSTPSQ
jgi:hypothetical protein